jgi:hypothetical protein
MTATPLSPDARPEKRKSFNQRDIPAALQSKVMRRGASSKSAADNECRFHADSSPQFQRSRRAAFRFKHAPSSAGKHGACIVPSGIREPIEERAASGSNAISQIRTSANLRAKYRI